MIFSEFLNFFLTHGPYTAHPALGYWISIITLLETICLDGCNIFVVRKTLLAMVLILDGNSVVGKKQSLLFDPFKAFA